MPPRAPRRGGSARSSPGRRSPRRPRRCSARPSSSHRAGADRSPASTASSSSMRTDHLLTLVDDVGIVQHANGVIPNRESGYCVDDVARLAVVALELARRGDEQVWTSIVYRSLAFLQDATDADGRDAELHGLRPALARRAASSATTSAARSGRSARSSRPPGSPPSSGRRDACSTRSSARSRPTRRCARAPTRRSDSPASTRTGSSPRRAALLERVLEQLAEAYAEHASDGLALVRGPAHLRQRAAAARADRRRRRARPRTI